MGRKCNNIDYIIEINFIQQNIPVLTKTVVGLSIIYYAIV